MTILTDPTDQTRTPRRIQRKRTRGWRMPEGAVYVGRGTRWDNPCKPLEISKGRWTTERAGQRNGRFATRQEALRWCVVGFSAFGPAGDATEEDVRRELVGRDLACWCPLDEPCHADVLLRIANGGERP